jgi:hypothetical protein
MVNNFQDVGKSILESYSRVLESLASNIVARIDDLLNIDELNRHSEHLSPGDVDLKIACSKTHGFKGGKASRHPGGAL